MGNTDRTLVACGRSKCGLGSVVGVAAVPDLTILGRRDLRRQRLDGQSCQYIDIDVEVFHITTFGQARLIHIRQSRFQHCLGVTLNKSH